MSTVKHCQEYNLYYNEINTKDKGVMHYKKEFVKNILSVVNILHKTDTEEDVLNPLNWKDALTPLMVDFDRDAENPMLQLTNRCMCSHVICFRNNYYWSYKDTTFITTGIDCVKKNISEILGDKAITNRNNILNREKENHKLGKYKNRFLKKCIDCKKAMTRDSRCVNCNIPHEIAFTQYYSSLYD